MAPLKEVIMDAAKALWRMRVGWISRCNFLMCLYVLLLSLFISSFWVRVPLKKLFEHPVTTWPFHGTRR